jgi:hypothetical protein
MSIEFTLASPCSLYPISVPWPSMIFHFNGILSIIRFLSWQILVRQQIWRVGLAHFSWYCADHSQLTPGQSSSQAGCFVLYGMWISVRLLMQIMPHQHVSPSLKINFHALNASWDYFMSLLLVTNIWILMSVTIYWSHWIAIKTDMYCSGSKPNTAMYSKLHYTYIVRVDREWKWMFTVSHFHSTPLPPKRTPQIHANVAPGRVLNVFVQSTLFWGLIYYDIYLLTVIGLSPGDSSTVHIYTQKIHRTIQNNQYVEQHNNFGRVRAISRLR